MKTIEKYILAVIGIMLIAFGAYVYASVHVTPVPDGWWGPNMLGTDDQVRANYDGNYDTMDCVKEAIPGDGQGMNGGGSGGGGGGGGA